MKLKSNSRIRDTFVAGSGEMKFPCIARVFRLLRRNKGRKGRSGEEMDLERVCLPSSGEATVLQDAPGRDSTLSILVIDFAIQQLPIDEASNPSRPTASVEDVLDHNSTQPIRVIDFAAQQLPIDEASTPSRHMASVQHPNSTSNGQKAPTEEAPLTRSMDSLSRELFLTLQPGADHAVPAAPLTAEIADAADTLIEPILEGKGTTDPAARPTKAESSKDGIKTVVLSEEGYELSQRLHAAVRQNRDLKEAEQDFLDNREYLESSLVQIKQERKMLEEAAAPQDNAAAESMHARYSQLQHAETQIVHELDDLRARANEIWYQMKQPIREMLDLVDNLLEGLNNLAPPTDDHNPEMEPPQVETAASTAHEQVGEVTHDDADVGAADQPEERYEKARRLIRDYNAAKLNQRSVERQFNMQPGRQVQEAEEFRARYGAGEDVGSPLDFQLNQLYDNQRLTGELIAAEENFGRVKAEAVNAGVDVIDVQRGSGFVDDVNDGYRLSYEEELIRDVDRLDIETWMGDIPEEAGTESDDCDVRSAELWESASMVAETPNRRRIDRWQREQQRLRGEL